MENEDLFKIITVAPNLIQIEVKDIDTFRHKKKLYDRKLSENIR